MRGLDLRNAALRRSLSTLAAGVVLVGASIQVASADANDDATMTAIKHVIVIIGENRTFDHIFATYEPVNKGETVLNLLSEGIVKPDGSPGPNYGKALQYRGSDTTTYQLAPLKAPYTTLPPALVGGPTTPYVCRRYWNLEPGRHATRRRTKRQAAKLENGLPEDYLKYLLTGGTGQKAKTPDRRISYDGRDASHLRPGPFQITSAKHPYDAYDASPCIASFKWPRSSTATPPRPPRKTLPAAPPISSHGSRPLSARAPTARRNRRTSRTKPLAKAQPRWASTTSMKAMRPT